MSERKANIRLLLRPALIVLPFIFGALFQHFTHCTWQTSGGFNIALWYIRIVLMVMFYFVLLKIDFKKLIPRKSHALILAANLAMGLIPYFVLNALGYRNLALAAFFVGVTPTANAAAVVMDFLEGKVEYVMTGFVITNVAIDLALIGLIPLVCGNFTGAFVLDVLCQILLVVAVPLLCAVFTRWICAFFKWKVPRVPGMGTFLLWSSSLFVIAAQSTRFFQQYSEITWKSALAVSLISFAICAVNFTCGKYLGGKEFKREASQTLGQKNTTLTIFLALYFGTPEAALGPASYVLWHNLWNALQMYRHDLQKTSNDPERE